MHSVVQTSVFLTMALPKQYDMQARAEHWRTYWQDNKIYAFNFDVSKPTYVVDTPPPYVSADHLHSGHIMSYSQAEFIVRYKRMQGHNILYPMGFDDNGLPTERFVEKKYNIDKTKITKSEFVKLCLEETKKGAQTYKNLWNGLGISVDWSMTYSTISPVAVKVSQWSMVDLWQKGALYRKELPMLWCPFCQTALAQADLEDLEEESYMNYINFAGPEGDLTIATTRPELIPAVVAIYVHPDDARFAGIIGKEVAVPLCNYSVKVHTSDAVDPEKGTGIMMVSTWGDQEDVEKWRTDNLETRSLFTPDGHLNELGGAYAGLSIMDARAQILIDMEAGGLLVKKEKITHAKNIHERCSTPTEFVQSKQWFIKMADNKDAWHEMGDKLRWFPDSRKHDFHRWVDSLKWDWCISRQRFFGVPLPIWYCGACEEPVFAPEESLPVDPTEQACPLAACPKCGHGEFIPEQDVADTWATSSCTPFLVRELVQDEEIKKHLFPVSLRPNAHEIIRTWDFYSVVKSWYHFGDIPFKDVMISGHGLDEQGRKISKRLGNFKPSDDLLAEHGPDSIRYWATGAGLGQDLRFNEAELEKGKKTINKLWNVAKLYEMHLGENTAFAEPTISSLEPADVWILQKLNATIKEATAGFESYQYVKARDAMASFFWSDVADNYVEFIKYRLWGDDVASKEAARSTLGHVLKTVLLLYAPILPFITEDLYSELFAGAAPSIHLESWPKALSLEGAVDISDFETALAAIEEIRKYKSTNAISLGKELEEYTLQTACDLEKYGHFIGKAIRVARLERA